jgi:hypothetical protein
MMVRRVLRSAGGASVLVGEGGISAACRCVIRCVAGILLGMVCVPAVSKAYAVAEDPAVYSSSGLPNGRVYEQVSPANTDGNEAGFGTSPYDVGVLEHYGVAAPDGAAVLFEGTGGMGESPWGASQWFVASKESSGWSTRAIAPRAQQTLGEVGGLLGAKFDGVDPSEDLSHTLIEPGRETLAPLVSDYCPEEPAAQLYLAGSDPLIAATWLEHPLIQSPESPIINCNYYRGGVAAGGNSDFSVVYFTYPGALLRQDASRASHAGSGEEVEAWGFYEYREGKLRAAGVLPDNELDSFGAVPAASGHGRSRVGNEVSENGERAFFVSPDPASCEEAGGQNDCAVDPPELYVREGGEKTVLVSEDVLSGGGPAPTGVVQMPNPTVQVGARPDGSYVFASADGSHAFFQSVDCLTEAALNGGACGGGLKTYDFDLETSVLSYLPGVVGEIVATNRTGSVLAFVRPEGGGKPAELSLWSAGSVTPVTQLPAPSSVPEARVANDGGVLVFSTASQLSSSFNSGGFEEIYRYDVASNALGCVSCAPAGVKPRGNAWFSDLYAGETFEYNEPIVGMRDDRGVSAEGSEIFFDSPDPLVAGDTNTDSPELPLEEEARAPQGRDVYEWDDGVVSLISSGKSARSSFLLDSSENGDDVFFTTDESLAAGDDQDGGYVVYDARVPEPGEKLAASGECGGSGCQGASRSQSLVTPPASASFSGLGNPAVEPASGPVVKVKTAAELRAERLAKALKVCRRDKKRSKRVACEKLARRKFGVVVKSSTGKGR